MRSPVCCHGPHERLIRGFATAARTAAAPRDADKMNHMQQIKTTETPSGTRPAPRKPRDLSVSDIADKLYAAILEHRIPPGTKLAEGRLAAIFSVNRARIREVLARLAHEQVVELVPHQGAYVAKPTVQDARDVFEARRLIEPFTVRKLATTLTDDKIGQLRQHLDKEAQARRQNDTPSIIRLSGEFHILLAELAGNASLLRTTRELSTQTCLIISLYSASTALSCRADEHAIIAQAIIDQDPDLAIELILGHFDHIQASLDLDDTQEEIDLESLFAGL
jgi:DNA-binding GntR family transcriptional regulator